MTGLTKDLIFREMYLGIHWLFFLVLSIIHFQLMNHSSSTFQLILLGYFVYLIYEFWCYCTDNSQILDKPLRGYLQSIVDISIITLCAVYYPAIYPILLTMMCLLILASCFKNSRSSNLVHGSIASLSYWTASVVLYESLADFQPMVILLQGLSLIFFSYVVAELNILFNHVFDQNEAAFAEIDKKNKLLEMRAKTDFLTDLYNHQAFYDALDSIASNVAPIGLILLDIDNFKKINDTYGHLAGDYVLREVAQVIRKNLRSSEIAARYGGEEFAILLPNACQQTAEIIAERIRVSVSNYVFEINGNRFSVTISGGIGISTVVLKKPEQSHFVDFVDGRLYEAKHTGKNRIISQEKEGRRRETICAL